MYVSRTDKAFKEALYISGEVHRVRGEELLSAETVLWCKMHRQVYSVHACRTSQDREEDEEPGKVIELKQL